MRISILLQQLANTFELSILVGAAYVGYRVFKQSNKTSQVISESTTRVIDLVNSMANNTIDVLDSIDIAPKVNYAIDSSRLNTSLSTSYSSFKVLTLTSLEHLEVKRTGRSKYLINTGKVNLGFDISFSGSVEYLCADVQVSAVDNVLLVKIGPPKVSISDIKISSTTESGNLLRQSDIKFETLQTLDQIESYPYYLGVFLNGLNDGLQIKGKMLNDAFASLSETLPSIIHSTAAAINEGVEYDVVLSQQNHQVTSVFVQTSNGEQEFTFAQIDAATKELILDRLKSQNQTATISIRELIGRLTKVKPLPKLANA